VVINSPSNPTGRVWPAAELRALAHGLAARSGPPVHVLSDEVYRELYFTADPAPSIAQWYPGALVAGSLSKSNALTGLRLGWLYGPPDVVAQATKVHQFVNTAASTFSQRVAIEILKDPGALAAHRPRYAESRAVLLDAAARAGLSLLEPEGAFYGFLRLPAGARGGLAARLRAAAGGGAGGHGARPRLRRERRGVDASLLGGARGGAAGGARPDRPLPGRGGLNGPPGHRGGVGGADRRKPACPGAASLAASGASTPPTPPRPAGTRRAGRSEERPARSPPKGTS
jgi:hypothetical protein